MPARIRRSTTTSYGWEHQKAVRRLKQAFRDGEPCRRCHKPMHLWQRLDGGHPIGKHAGDGSLPDALEHYHCNRSAGAQEGNRRRSQALRRRLPQW